MASLDTTTAVDPTTLMDLPMELLDLICRHLCAHCKPDRSDPRCLFDGRSALFELCRTNRIFFVVAQPYVFHVCSIYSSNILSYLMRTVVERPDLARHIAVFQDRRDRFRQKAEFLPPLRGDTSNSNSTGTELTTLGSYVFLLRRLPLVRFVLLDALYGDLTDLEKPTPTPPQRLVFSELQLICENPKDPLHVDMTDKAALCKLVPVLRSWETHPWEKTALPVVTVSGGKETETKTTTTTTTTTAKTTTTSKVRLRRFHMRHHGMDAEQLQTVLGQTRGTITKVQWRLLPPPTSPVQPDNPGFRPSMQLDALLDALLPWCDTLEELEVYDLTDAVPTERPIAKEYAKLPLFHQLRVFRFAFIQIHDRNVLMRDLVPKLPPQMESARLLALGDRTKEVSPLPGLLGSGQYGDSPLWQDTKASRILRYQNADSWKTLNQRFEEEGVELVGH